MKTTAVFFPFDLFGSAGTAEGVHLLAEALREMIADNRRETVETRARAYTDHLRLKEINFETLLVAEIVEFFPHPAVDLVLQYFGRHKTFENRP